jgi:sec-independent protein translocase protein TatA
VSFAGAASECEVKKVIEISALWWVWGQERQTDDRVTDMYAFLQGTELWVVLGVVVLIFGGSQIPKLARSIGQAQKEFKKGINEGMTDDAPTNLPPPPKA